MKPEVDQILGLSAQHLMGGLAPLLPEGYPQASASLIGVMLMLSAQEYERGAEIRALENADMRALFASSRVEDTELAAVLAKAAATRDASLRISALNAENTELRRVLIRLQAYAEERGLKELEARIWTVLKASADRRFVSLA